MKCTMSAEIRHTTVYHENDAWAAVPANNGGNGPTWQWGDEILVGFTRGTFAETLSGHQCDNARPFDSWLARSTDGGETWATWLPQGYAGQPGRVRDLSEAVDFLQPGTLVRVQGNGYHGNSGSCWYYSADKGAVWNGPFGFGGLLSHPELEGKEFTGRTGYIVETPRVLSLFLSARLRLEGAPGGVRIEEKAFVARSEDGGKSFAFVAWIVPWTDPCRAVMAAPVRLSATHIVAALRRKSPSANWIDCYRSSDRGATWSFLSRVATTEAASTFNGNPPALIQSASRGLCCVFGNRSDCEITAMFSGDEGITWGDRQVLRSDFSSVNGFPDLGYPRLFERSDGRLVAVYFWCTPDRPQTHLEATIF